ncbi:CheR family methyltransferase [Pseudoduganella violaceinigra]|uniref:CheR family methyltransferase n=1 Tax=Pseudoduganella violaceinigra TaxID=246602 RepID=UPI000400105F|nr:CheR family methyltransferase [Pseudoduganella violaceinigra]
MNPRNAPAKAEQDKASALFPLIGIGASAGGLQALQRLLPGLPSEPGLAIVVIMHLPADLPSHLAEALQRCSKMPVLQVTEHPTEVRPNHVYVIAPGTLLKMEGRFLIIDKAGARGAAPRAIDHFLHSLALSHRQLALGVLLSGMGSDGCAGLAAVRAQGGAAVVQLPQDAQHPALPQAAVDAGQADAVLPAGEIAPRLLALAAARRGAAPEEGEAQAVQDVLTIVNERTGHDFRNYKRPTILRRLEHRLLQYGAHSVAEYRALLVHDGAEAAQLMHDLLIGVTGFFRDRQAFERLREVALRAMLDARAKGEMRAWVAACSTGQEAYSLAIMLADIARIMPRAPRIHIFASDVDEQALAVARAGLYPEAIRDEVPAASLERYFEHAGGQYRVRQPLREMITFASHNLLRDPPFAGLDLVSCRNFMIYLDRSKQKELLQHLHFGLGGAGYLFLGNAETAGTMPELFAPVDRTHRIYRAHSVQSRWPGSAPGYAAPPERAAPPASMDEMRDRLAVAEIGCEQMQSNNEELTTINSELKARLADSSMANDDLNNMIASVDLATVFVDPALVVWRFTPRAAGIFNLIPRDVGRSLLDITHRLHYPELARDVAHALDHLQPLEREVPGTDGRHFMVRVRPYRTAEDVIIGAVLTFFDISQRRAEDESARAVASDQEFQLSLGDALRPLADPMALLALGCRLLGERLAVPRLAYADIRAGRYAALPGHASGAAPLQGEGAVDALGAAVLVRWSAGEAVAEPDLACGAARGGGLAAMAGGSGALLGALCRKGQRWLGFFLACQPSAREWTPAEAALFAESTARIGAAFERARAQAGLLASETRLRALLHGLAQSCWETDGAGQVVDGSAGWQARTGQAPGESLGEGWLDAVHPDDRAGLRHLWRDAVRHGAALDAEVRLHSPGGAWPRASVLAMPLRDAVGDVEKWFGCSIDSAEHAVPPSGRI